MGEDRVKVSSIFQMPKVVTHGLMQANDKGKRLYDALTGSGSSTSSVNLALHTWAINLQYADPFIKAVWRADDQWAGLTPVLNTTAFLKNYPKTMPSELWDSSSAEWRGPRI